MSEAVPPLVPEGPDVVQAFADRLPLPLLELTPQGLALRVNAAFCVMTGLTPVSALGIGWLSALPLDSRPALELALTQRADFRHGVRLLCVDGHRAWVEVEARWLAHRGSYLCNITDVTAIRLRELVAQGEAEQFRLLANNVPVSIAYYERAGFTCQFANRLYAHTFGRDERSIIGLTVAQVIGAEAARQIQPAVDKVLADHIPATYEREVHSADGQTQFIEVHLLPHLSRDSGETVGAFVLISDITRHRLAERDVRQSQERLAKFMQASVEGIVFHKDGLITDVNPPLLGMLGHALDDMMGRSTLDFVAPDQRARVREAIVSGDETSYESVVLHKSGLRIPVEFIVRTMMFGDERLRMTIVRDQRDREAAQARIHYLAHHDALTGLPNRGAFLEDAAMALAQASRSADGAALLFVDIDHFKRVNDSLGHLAGDALLRVVAQRLTAALRATDLVGRFAGDEFVVLLTGEVQRPAIEDVARKLLDAISAPIEIDGPSITVTPSIGIARYPTDSGNAADLIQHADTAMYHAKARGRAQYMFFEPSMAQDAFDALVLESELAAAVRAREFELHYQPQLRLSDDSLVGVEALLRWRHPTRGLLSPGDFVPLAEARRLMIDIGRWVLGEALRRAVHWRALGLAAVPVGVNLSSMHFGMADFAVAVEAALAEAGAGGDCLELELTERMLMEDLPTVRTTLDRLRAQGIRVAVDDFGTGYTSLARLKELPIDRLKIDQSFIVGLPGDAAAGAIADAIVRMAAGLRLGVVAEGVETEPQRRWLALHDCNEVQGHLIAAPMDAAAFEAWLRERAARVTPLASSSAASSGSG
jgi:diguanylate cyclase (GGDEF)-like protein/PAS domain S-box-containing protein